MRTVCRADTDCHSRACDRAPGRFRRQVSQTARFRKTDSPVVERAAVSDYRLSLDPPPGFGVIVSRVAGGVS